MACFKHTLPILRIPWDDNPALESPNTMLITLKGLGHHRDGSQKICARGGALSCDLSPPHLAVGQVKHVAEQLGCVWSQ
eukprot:1139199-Pelagomonas_calceolata.AAC.2